MVSGKIDRVYTGVCRCDKQSIGRGDLFCSYCGLPSSVPWWIAEGEPLDGYNCLPVVVNEQGCAVRLVLDTSKLGNLVFVYLRTESPAKMLAAMYEDSAAAVSWESATRTATLYWPRDKAPQGHRISYIDLYFTLERPLDHSRDMPPREIAMRYPIQPPRAIEFASRDARVSEGVTATELIHIVEPVLKTDALSFTLAGDALDLEAVRSVVVYRPDGFGRRIELVPEIRRRRVVATLLDAHWTMLFPKGNAGAKILLVLSPMNAANCALGSVPVQVELVALDLKLAAKRLTFKFTREAHNWVHAGVPDHVDILKKSGDWSRFSIDIRPVGGLEEVVTLTSSVTDDQLEIRAHLKPRYARSARAVRQGAGFKAAVVLQRANGHAAAGPLFKLLNVDISATPRDPVDLVAIDFGTTNSASAAITFGNYALTSKRNPVEPVKFRSGIDMPTTLYYKAPEDDPDGVDVEHSVIGEAAKAELFHRSTSEQRRYLSGLKTMLIESVKQRRGPQPLIPISETVFKTAEEICADFLYLFLREVFESPTLDGRAVKKLVFTFPVESSHEYRDKLTAILSDALKRLGHPVGGGGPTGDGVEIRSSFDEATAGGLWWFFERYAAELPVDAHKIVLVYDYGGGTTDLSLLRFDKRGDGVIQARVLGVAGGELCGGDDVTWRMAREFFGASRASLKPWVQPGTRLEKKMRTAAECVSRPRGIWKREVPFLISFIDELKIALLGGKPEDDPQLPEVFNAPGLPAAAARWINQTGIEKFFSAKQAGNGRFYAAPFKDNQCTFDDTAFHSRNRPDETRKRESVLGLLAYDLMAQDGSGECIMHEALGVLQVARQLMRRVLAGGKADHLLVIGQASQAPVFKAEIARELNALSKSPPVILDRSGGIDPKTCVANGACFSESKERWLVRTPTALKDILYETGVNDYSVVLKSSQDRNQSVAVSSDLSALFGRARPAAQDLHLDLQFDFMQVPPSVFTLLHGAEADWSGLTASFNVMVADLRDSGYRHAVLKEAEICAQINDLVSADSSLLAHLFLAIWPQERPFAAMIFGYRL